MSFKLHYAEINSQTDIPCFEFKKHNQMIDFIDEHCINRNSQVVWLIAKDNFTDVFISENHLSIQNFLMTKYLWQTTGNYFLQEYESFEEAYGVALSIAENSELCYSK